MFLYRLIARLITFFTDRRQVFDQELLLQLISAAAEHDLPPAEIIEAHAADCGYRKRDRLRALADRLKNGSSLGDAIELTPGLLPDRALLSVRFGSEQGTLNESLAGRSNEDQDQQTEAAIEQIVDACSYALTMAIIVGLIAAFQIVKCLPTVSSLYAELLANGQPMNSSIIPESIELPAAMQTLLQVTALSGPLVVGTAIAILFVVWWIASGRMNRALRMGWIARLLRTQHLTLEASALEQLAVAKDAGRPLATALDSLARNHPQPRFANRLRQARSDHPDRPSIWSALSGVHLIDAAESRSLVLSESLSNTAWVLRQFAQKRRHNAATRLQVFAQLVMPAFVLIVAATTAFLAMAMLAPIFHATSLVR